MGYEALRPAVIDSYGAAFSSVVDPRYGLHFGFHVSPCLVPGGQIEVWVFRRMTQGLSQRAAGWP
jgi:hypothetical protein